MQVITRNIGFTKGTFSVEQDALWRISTSNNHERSESRMPDGRSVSSLHCSSASCWIYLLYDCDFCVVNREWICAYFCGISLCFCHFILPYFRFLCLRNWLCWILSGGHSACRLPAHCTCKHNHLTGHRSVLILAVVQTKNPTEPSVVWQFWPMLRISKY